MVTEEFWIINSNRSRIKGIDINSYSCDLVNNLSMLYRQQNRFIEAREMINRCEPTSETLAANYNNHGMFVYVHVYVYVYVW